jgi:hypothetical protein
MMAIKMSPNINNIELYLQLPYPEGKNKLA